jgi:MOSC domain-containing protein YiiM
VTLIEGEALDRIAAEHGVAVRAGEHRRNLVTRGVRLFDLAARRVRIGEAVLVWSRPRPPCPYIATVTERRMTRALGGNRGGVCMRVLTGGRIAIGDPIEILMGPPRPEDIWESAPRSRSRRG